MMPIIFLFGTKGVGKSTVARAIELLVPGAARIALADPLKDFCEHVIGIPREALRGPSEARNAKLADDVIAGGSAVEGWAFSLPLLDGTMHRLADDLAYGRWHKGMTARSCLRHLGDIGRAIDPDIWVNIAIARSRRLLVDGAPLVVVEDGRYRNELLAFKQAGALCVRVTRDVEADASHSSEQEQATVPAWWFDDRVENDGDMHDLVTDAARIVSLRSWEVIGPVWNQLQAEAGQ